LWIPVTKTRRKFTAEQKAAIVRRHLKDKEPISSIAEELSIQPTQIHQWVALALEQVEQAFEKSARSEKGFPAARSQDQRAQRPVPGSFPFAHIGINQRLTDTWLY
jgi:transposase-like protein